MGREGYTLVEMLVALVILSLALGGLFQAVHVIGRIQDAARRSITLSRLEGSPQPRLDWLLNDQGPFFSDAPDGFTGSSSTFSFPCSGAFCSARINTLGPPDRLEIARGGLGRFGEALSSAGRAAFQYVGEQTLSETWPPPKVRGERLVRIVLLDHRPNGVAPLASVRLWRAAPRDCSYDPIALACRSSAP
jgi:prepilin-type N-terminal cleavage/methylation domain-containing protein